MKNMTKYAELGAAKIQNNSHYDLQVTDMQTLLTMAETNLIEAIETAFHAGVEAGSRIEKKIQAANK